MGAPPISLMGDELLAALAAAATDAGGDAPGRRVRRRAGCRAGDRAPRRVRERRRGRMTVRAGRRPDGPRAGGPRATGPGRATAPTGRRGSPVGAVAGGWSGPAPTPCRPRCAASCAGPASAGCARRCPWALGAGRARGRRAVAWMVYAHRRVRRPRRAGGRRRPGHAEQVRAAAAVPHRAAAGPGRPRRRSRTRVAALPAVESVEVSRDWPGTRTRRRGRADGRGGRAARRAVRRRRRGRGGVPDARPAARRTCRWCG